MFWCKINVIKCEEYSNERKRSFQVKHLSLVCILLPYHTSLSRHPVILTTHNHRICWVQFHRGCCLWRSCQRFCPTGFQICGNLDKLILVENCMSRLSQAGKLSSRYMFVCNFTYPLVCTWETLNNVSTGWLFDNFYQCFAQRALNNVQ